MTQEEFEKLPVCLGYKNAERDCPHIHSDDWDELEDSCHNCGYFKYAEKERLLKISVKEALLYQE